MKYTVLFTQKYQKNARKFLRKHPEMFDQYKKTIALLEKNPFHPSLRLHALTRNLKGLHSVSLNMSYRMSMEFYIENETIVPISIGSHDDVY